MGFCMQQQNQFPLLKLRQADHYQQSPTFHSLMITIKKRKMGNGGSLLYNYQSMQQKKEQIFRRIRREEREKLFEKIRLELLSDCQEKGRSSIAASQDGQEEILESIKHYRKDSQPLNFDAINLYICEFKGEFREDFKEELLVLALHKFNNNLRALACAANLLSKCEACETINRMDMQTVLHELLTTNTHPNSGAVTNAQVLTYLLYQLLRLFTNKECFGEIKEYYPGLLKANGYFNLVMLLLLAQASNYRALLPQEVVIEALLNKEFFYDTLSEATIYKLCEVLDNYLRFQSTPTLYQLYSDWIEKRLREKFFPLKLKPDLIRMMIVIINSLDPSSPFIEYLSKLGVVKEILFLARFGNNDCKMASLEFIIALLKLATPDLLAFYVQEYLLIEVMIFSLDLKLQPELTFQLLTTLALVLSVSSRYIRKAYQLGLHNVLPKFSDCKYQRNLVQAALLLEQTLSLVEV